MVELARAPGVIPHYADLIGKPYKRGARGPEAFDCYGCITELSKRCGLSVPDYDSNLTIQLVADLAERSMPFWTPCVEGPGAIAAFRIPVRVDGRYQSRVTHVGMVLPYGEFIHAWEGSSVGICVEPLEVWKNRLAGFYRYDPK